MKSGRSRPLLFGIAAVPILGMGASTLFTVGVGVLAPFLLADLSAGRMELGLLASVAYVVAALVAPWAGRFVNGFGVRRSMSLLFVVSASALGLVAGATTYVVALCAAALAGLGEAANAPFTNRVVHSVFSRRWHGIVVAAKQSGVKGSHLIAGAALPMMAMLWGRRFAVVVFAVAAAVGAPLSWLLLRGVSSPQGTVSRAPRAPAGHHVRVLAAYAGLMAVGQAPVQVYLPLFGTEAVGLSLQSSALALAVSSGVAIAARRVWGALSTRLRTLGPTLVVLALGSCLSVAMIAAGSSLGGVSLWAGAVLFGCTAAAWSTLVHLDVLRTTTAGSVGWASGLVHMAFLIGLSVGPIVFGWIVEWRGAYTPARVTGIAVFALAALTAALGRRHSITDRAQP